MFINHVPDEMPHNREAEQALLGAMLTQPRVIDDVVDRVGDNTFYYPAHRKIYAAIRTIHEGGGVPSPVALKPVFEGDPDLSQVGGAEYLADLAANVVMVSNSVEYAKILADLELRRDLIRTIDATRGAAHKIEVDTTGRDALEGLEENLFKLAETGETTGPEPIAAGLDSALDMIQAAQKGERVGIKTGISALDDINNGFMAPQLIVLAGRPSMGKTALAMTMALNMAETAASVMFFSMEMGREEVSQRLLARESGIATGRMLKPGAINAEDFNALMAGRTRLAKLALALDESGNLAPAQIRARARRHKRKHGLDAIFIDYLGLMNFGGKYHSLVDQIGEAVGQLKALAKDLHVPVIVLAQLNRSVESREDKRPGMSDLRDSGKIEEHSDVILLLHREEYYLERSEPRRREKETDEAYQVRCNSHHDRVRDQQGKADIIISKWRNGRAGEIVVGFNGKRQLFHDLEGGA